MTSVEQTFGQAFGSLIRKKRGQEGLTQKDLAIRAFDDEGKTRRIIELEKGSVKRPHASTVDPLVVYFNISDAELKGCRAHGLFSDQEQKAIGLSREILENLAQRFEHENPDAPDEELIAHLKTKADELKQLRARLSELEDQAGSLKNQIGAADRAFEFGRFDEADEILAAAEVQQEERTLKEVRTQARIRFARGDAALFRGNPDIAAIHYAKAAEYFLGLDRDEVATVLSAGARQVYEHERRVGKQRFMTAIGLAQRALEMVEDTAPSDKWALYKYRLALLEQNEGRAQRHNSLEFLSKAIENAQEALSRCQTLSNDAWASLMTLLGNCHLERGRRDNTAGWEADLDFAITTYEALSNDTRIETLNEHRCHVFNNLAAACIERARRADGEEKKRYWQKAKEAAKRAIELSSEDHQIDIWSAAQMNLGHVLMQATSELNDERAKFLRIQAISAFNASLETFNESRFEAQMAHTQFLLGRAYLEHALGATLVSIREIYLAQAIAAYQTALQIFAKNAQSPQWFDAHFYMGLCYFFHSEIADENIVVDDLRKALSLFEIALPGFQHPELTNNMSLVEEKIRETRALLTK
jgi:tetratricopeptide (TPR) repeat protein